MSYTNYSEIVPEIVTLAEKCRANSQVAPELYTKFDVKRGLRDINGDGVVAGLTNVSSIVSHETIDGVKTPCEGQLRYRGYEIQDILGHLPKDSHFGFETATYLLLFGEYPTDAQLTDFKRLLAHYRQLPPDFVRDVVMMAPSPNVMNGLARSILTLYSYDDKADDTSLENVLRQSLELIATMPLLAVYSYQAFRHYHRDKSLYIHNPDPNLSTAENILRLLRPDRTYTDTEASVLDLALLLHAEHGGGNNSTFTTRVVSSSGTDTYAAMAAALGSLKGPKHGGANIKVIEMFQNIQEYLVDWNDEEDLAWYLGEILDKRAFDKAGLIYGMGHAVYSLSDPRAKIMESFVEGLAQEKGRVDEFRLYQKIAHLAPKVIGEKRKIYKGVSANVDFFSGFIYSMLDLPKDLYTPIFAIARMAGWSAHRMEELIGNNKIIRPAYKAVGEERTLG